MSQHTLRIRRRGGFTIIETVIAIVVLTVAIPPMLWAIHEAHHHRANAVLTSRARWLAQEKLEDVIADRYSTSRGYEFLQEYNYPPEDPAPGFAGFARLVTIAETGPDLTTPGDGYKVVTARVTWDDSSGASRTLSISTVLTEFSS